MVDADGQADEKEMRAMHLFVENMFDFDQTSPYIFTFAAGSLGWPKSSNCSVSIFITQRTHLNKSPKGPCLKMEHYYDSGQDWKECLKKRDRWWGSFSNNGKCWKLEDGVFNLLT